MEYRMGTVAELDAGTARARVLFEADDALLSWWLPVLQARTLADQVYWMPDLDETVVCLMDSAAEFGVILGAIYSAVDVPPVASLDKLHIRMKDGTTFEYDREAHRLELTVVAGDVILNVDEDRTIHLGGEAGQALATRAFVEAQYNTHVHLSAAPGSPTSPPVTPAPLVPGADITKKQKSE